MSQILGTHNRGLIKVCALNCTSCFKEEGRGLLNLLPEMMSSLWAFKTYA